MDNAAEVDEAMKQLEKEKADKATLFADCPFKPGDLVKLKSGGPPMTIEAIELRRNVKENISASKYAVLCAWFTEDGDAENENFSHDSLQHTQGRIK